MGEREGQGTTFESLAPRSAVSAANSFGVRVSQTAVRTLLVVFDLPYRDLPPRIEHVLKPTHHQTLFSQPSVKAFHPPILRRFSQLNVH